MRDQTQFNGRLADPEFRFQRASRAGQAARTAGAVTRILRVMGELSPEQIETIRAALPAPTETQE